jgi:hypothetical protein
MNGVQMMLKAILPDLTPEQLAMVMNLIPQLPAKINEVITGVNKAIANFDQRLINLEMENQKLRVAIENLTATEWKYREENHV